MADQYVAVWCNEGLESLVNITQIEQKQVVSALSGEVFKGQRPGEILNYFVMRAKFNAQRHYEIYAFTSDIPEVSILEAFENTPQLIVDTIREIGHKVYSDRKTSKDLIT